MPQVESMEIVTPKPFYKVKFGCTYRAFYDVLNRLDELFNENTQESFRGKYSFEEFCSIKRDSDGDLSEVHLYTDRYCQEVQECLTEFICAVKKEFGIPSSEEIDKLDIHFTMW